MRNVESTFFEAMLVTNKSPIGSFLLLEYLLEASAAGSQKHIASVRPRHPRISAKTEQQPNTFFFSPRDSNRQGGYSKLEEPIALLA